MRLLEFAIIFGALPLVFTFAGRRFPAIPALWLVTGLCLWMLLRDPSFDRAHLWGWALVPRYLPGMLAIFSAVAIGFTLAVWRLAPHILFQLPRNRPALWLLILCLYPVLSVYPQGIIYRAFLFHRYAPLFGNGMGLILASAVAFGFVHIIFRNGWAVGLTVIAGVLFAARYQQTGSIAVTSLEHALYGCLMFTVGMGSFFYHAPVR